MTEPLMIYISPQFSINKKFLVHQMLNLAEMISLLIQLPSNRDSHPLDNLKIIKILITTEDCLIGHYLMSLKLQMFYIFRIIKTNNQSRRAPFLERKS
jgi:hypothetical protein